MGQNVISLSVTGRRIKCSEHVKPTAGNRAHDLVSITLDDEWKDLDKRVTFYRDGVEVTLPYAEQIEVPWEVLQHSGSFGVTVVGSKDGEDRLVTAAMSMSERIRVNANGEDEGVEPKPATEDILVRVERIAGEIESGEAGRESRFEAFMETAGTNVQQATDNASGAATEAQGAAANANAATANANTATANANQAASEILEAAQRGEFDGKDGDPGTPGKDGKTPVITATKDGKVTTIKSDGVEIAQVVDGTDGEPGQPGSDASATDVRINGTSITSGGVADIPVAANNAFGLFKPWGNTTLYGLASDNGGSYLVKASDDNILERNTGSTATRYRPITPSSLDYAVKAAMTDGKGAAWTDAEKLAARERMGFGQYKLLATLNISEEVKHIDFVPDKQLHDVVISVTNLASTFQTSDYFMVLPNMLPDNAYRTEIGQAVPPNTTVNAWGHYVVDGVSYALGATGSGEGSFYQSGLIFRSVKELESLTHLRFFFYSGNFKPGATIKVYAR